MLKFGNAWVVYRMIDGIKFYYVDDGNWNNLLSDAQLMERSIAKMFERSDKNITAITLTSAVKWYG